MNGPEYWRGQVEFWEGQERFWRKQQRMYRRVMWVYGVLGTLMAAFLVLYIIAVVSGG